MSTPSTPDDERATALTAVAVAVLERGGHPVEWPAEDLPRLAAAVRSSDLAVTDGGIVSVTDPGVLAHFVVERAASDAAASWDDLDAFNVSLNRFARVRYRLPLDDEAWTRFLVALRDDHGLDALALLRRGAETEEEGKPHRVLWSLYREVSNALPALAPDPDYLAEQVGPVLEAVANDAASGSMYGAVRAYAATSEKTAAALVTAFLQDSDRPSVALAANALGGSRTATPWPLTGGRSS